MNVSHAELSEMAQNVVPVEAWGECGAPPPMVALAQEEHDSGIKAGLVQHDKLGWCVLLTYGVAPHTYAILASEHDATVTAIRPAP